jgi:hypothetical protein
MGNGEPAKGITDKQNTKQPGNYMNGLNISSFIIAHSPVNSVL